VLGGGLGGPRRVEVSVRTASPADAAAIAAVQGRAWRAHYADLLSPSTLEGLTAESVADAWREAVERPPSSRHAVLVALSGDTVVGFAAVAPATDAGADDLDGELVALVVDPAHQRVGHGSRLMSAATQTLRDAGVARLSVWVPAADRVLLDFHVSAGLVPDGSERTLAGPSGERLHERRLSARLE